MPAAPVITAIEHGGGVVSVAGSRVTNLAAFNFAGLMANSEVQETTSQALYKYGVGSCGPRGFYGSIDKHIELEAALAKFLAVDEAILYSYGFATIASAIPAFAKKSDLIVADKGVSFAVQTGIRLSRSTVLWYEHNDMADLERVLRSATERAAARGDKLNRRFIVTEGLFANTGVIADLPRIVELKNAYKFRLMMEESCSFGVLGATGRGVFEHYNIPISEALFITASLAYALGCEGGFCAGPTVVVDHQRLSGLGYCYSASAPPMLSAATTTALGILRCEPERLVRLRENAVAMRGALTAQQHAADVLGSAESPVIHLRLRNQPDALAAEHVWDELAARALERGVLVTRAKYNLTEEYFDQIPSLRVVVSAAHTPSQIAEAANVIASLLGGSSASVPAPVSPAAKTRGAKKK